MAQVKPRNKGLKFASNFGALPILKTGTQTYQYSSTDPAEDQFNDYSHWLYTDKDSNAVLAEIEGPGTIYRIWSTGNSGDSNRIKVYIDGEKNPRIDNTFNEFHSHRPLRDKPQVGSGGDHYLAWWSYLPIPFRKSIRIVREGNMRPFYNITYHTYSDGDGVSSFTGKESLAGMKSMWNHPDKDPKPVKGNIGKRSIASIAAGDSLVLFDQDGAGYIASLKIADYANDKRLRIRMYWDGSPEAAVDAPLKWFFGSIDNGGDVKALGVGTIDNKGYCHFPMPYWKHARIVVLNGMDEATPKMKMELQYNRMPYPEKNSGYFHAYANEEDQPARSYRCLKTTGRGHVIGMAKRMPDKGHACEGDEVFYIDNRRFPDIYGTGEEDYANCAWWKNSYNSYPTHGAIGNDCYYRMHYPDVLVYEQGIDMEFETWQHHYVASLVWYYHRDESSLELTDSIDVGEAAAESKHSFKIEGEKWSGERRGIYPGKRIYQDTLSDNGRSFDGFCEFVAGLSPKNNGVRIRVRSDHSRHQGVRVFIDGKQVTERAWIISKNNYDAIWVDSDFEVPAKYTSGKSSIRVRLERLNGYGEWVGYGYEVYSYK